MFGRTIKSEKNWPRPWAIQQKEALMGEQDQNKVGGAVPGPPPGNPTIAQAAGAAGVDVGAFDPGEHTAADVKDVLAEATEAERAAIAGQEQAGDGRKSVLAAAGVAEGQRFDLTGREMHPWETAPKRGKED